MSDTEEQPERRSVRITVGANGPYQVDGAPKLVRRTIVRSEHGESITWRTTAQLDSDATMWLCRCGSSRNKPFCDGSHNRIGFDGTETAPGDTYADRSRQYPTPGMVIHDDRSLCAHAGFCGNRVTNVWKMAKAEATEDSVVRAQAMAMIDRCPSGALSYSLTGDADVIEQELATEVAVVADGPLFVTGGIPIDRSDGQRIEARNRVVLCRCGQSINKPLCDGSHAKAGFADH